MTSVRAFMSSSRLLLICAAMTALVACGRTPSPRTFSTPEDAARTLIDATKAGKVEEVLAIFGQEGRELLDTSDPAAARRNREVFTAAAAEKWRLVDQGDTKVLVIGNEEWPFPVPLVKDANGWHFDTAAGKEEVIARRIGRNELAAIRLCRTYVRAQRLYAERAHDGQRAGLYARRFRSDPGKQNGLYWPAGHADKRSPLGDLVAQAAAEGTSLGKAGSQPSPFHGYYFRILSGQGAGANGGARNYVVQDQMSGGFALVAWPAQYDVTGVMTFIVNQDGIIHEKDLGSGTDDAAKRMDLYNPDGSWTAVE